ncbi:MAG: hypothetical protein WC415_02760 [Patescibacteria group bacterium]|jgi:hypothetical protein
MFKKIFKAGIFVSVLSAFFTAANFAWAQDNFGLNIGSQLMLGDVEPRVVVVRIIQIVLSFLGLLAVGLIIYAGFLWMTAAGDESRIERAKKIIINAVIGLIIILSSLIIATYVINRLSETVDGGNSNSNQNNNRGSAGFNGAGVLGACSVDSVYPVPEQKNVPRNSAVLVTFKEEVDPATICASVDASGLCNGSTFLPGSTRIYKTVDGRENFLSGVRVYNTSDNKNFTFSPAQYLGSASENIVYSVYLSNEIMTVAGDPVFKNCGADYMEWQFEVSNVLDLDPPYIKENGVWPALDNEKDGAIVSVAAWATGRILVASQPKIYSTSTVSNVVIIAGPSVDVKVDKNSSQTGNLTLIVLQDGIKAQLKNGSASLGVANFNNNNEIEFPGILTLRASGAVDVGNSWTMSVQAAVQADTLTIGREVYVFAATGANGSNQIPIGAGADRNQTAANIASIITNHPDVNATAQDEIVNITATIAGQAGNNISLITSAPAALVITSLSGGVSVGSNPEVKGGQRDKPMNSLIKINFNEAILPSLVVGTAEAVGGHLRIINAASNSLSGAVCSSDLACRSFNCFNGACAGNYLTGSFKIANQYKTVEFTSNKQCGVNGCGEPIYCLPSSGNLKVEIQAASLATCTSENDCVSKSPYNKCTGNVCRQANGEIYPQSDLAVTDGIMDVAFNSLDGNRDGAVVGPANFYNENSPNNADGDNFTWTFFISDKMEISSPAVTSLSPGANSSGASLRGDIKIIFNKPMSTGTLKTGFTEIKSGQNKFTHKNINIWSLSDSPVGYWIESSDIDVNSDGEVDSVEVSIKHGSFGEILDYRAQIGSGVKDIYQNCYKPSSGPDCNASETNPSCCDGSPTSILDTNGNCQ